MSEEPHSSQGPGAPRRHALPECAKHNAADVDAEKARFCQLLVAYPVSDKALLQLQKHNYYHTKQTMPASQLNGLLPSNSQVSPEESTVAYAYTQGSAFAADLNHLMFQGQWEALFCKYGYLVSCLCHYMQKMQECYGREQVLYRGTRGDPDVVLRTYQRGKALLWCAISSTSRDRRLALDFAYSSNGGEDEQDMPVLFEIKTRTRGAPLLEWSAFPNEDEVLLMPFQAFEVVDVGRATFADRQGPALLVKLKTVKLPLVSHGPDIADCIGRNIEDEESRARDRGVLWTMVLVLVLPILLILAVGKEAW